MKMLTKKNVTTRRRMIVALSLFILLCCGSTAAVGLTTNDDQTDAVVVPNPALKIAGFRGRIMAANRSAKDRQRVPKGSEYYNAPNRPGTNLLARPSAFTMFGETIPDDLNAEQVIEAAGLHNWQCEKVSSFSTTGSTIPIFDADGNPLSAYRHEVDGETGNTTLVPFAPPEYEVNRNSMGKAFTVTRRSDNRHPLGTVGQDYAVMQHDRVIRSVHEMSGQETMDWEYVGLVDKGKQMFGCVLLDNDSAQSHLANSPDERFNTYLVVANSHDGKGSFRYSWVTLRGACWNAFATGVQAIGRGNSIRAAGSEVVIRHNANLENNVEKLERSIHGMEQMNREFLNYAELMKAWEMNEAEMFDFWVNMLAANGGLSQDPNRIEADGTNRWGLSTEGLNILDNLMNIRDMEQNQIDGMENTIWGAVQILIDYEDHEKLYDTKGNVKEKTLANALHGKGMQNKNGYLSAGIGVVTETTDAGLLLVQQPEPIAARNNGTGLNLGPKVSAWNRHIATRNEAGRPVLRADGTPAQPVGKAAKDSAMTTVILE